MAKMPSVATARNLAKQMGLQGVIIVAIGDGQFAAASYGDTKKQCRALAPVVDMIGAAIEDSTLDMTAFS